MTKESMVYYPTEQEKQEAGKHALDAAFNALIPLSDEDIEFGDLVVRCIGAFKEARKAANTYERSLLEKHPECNSVSLFIETSDVVFSAFYCRLSGLDPSECAPRSVGGFYVAAMANAVKTLDAVSSIHSWMDDDCSYGDYLAGEAADIVGALKKK